MATSSTTMNWAATTTVSAIQRLRSRALSAGIDREASPRAVIARLPKSFTETTITEANDLARYTCRMTSIAPEVGGRPRPRVPRELLQSTGYLLGRLGYALKSRSSKEFELAGSNPDYYSALALRAEG